MGMCFGRCGGLVPGSFDLSPTDGDLRASMFNLRFLFTPFLPIALSPLSRSSVPLVLLSCLSFAEILEAPCLRAGRSESRM